MTRAQRSNGLAIAALLAASAVVGAARADAGEGASASDVTVRGTPASTASGFVSKGSEADATREVTDVASLLDPLPGVHVRRTGADDTFSTLSIRGSTSSEVAVLFAGVPLTGGADPSLDLSSLPLWPGAKVRVFRSFTPASVGSGSLGGTLTLEPPKPTDAEGSLVWVGVGSYGEERLRLADVRALMDGRARIVTAFSAGRATDDFTYYDATNLSASGPPSYATRQNDQHASLNAFTALALPLDLGGGEPGTVTVTAMAQARLQHLPGAASSPTIFAEVATNRELLSFDVAKPIGNASALHLIGWTRRDELASRDAPAPLNSVYTDTPASTDDVTLGAGGAASWRTQLAQKGSIEARVDGSFERFAPGNDVSEFGVEPGATRASVGGGADAEWRPWARWGLSASGRMDVSVDGADAAKAGSNAIAPAVGTDVRPTGHVGTEVLVGPVTLSAHGGALARPASFVERYGDGAILANPTLRSESAVTVDAGARYAAKTHGWKVQAELDGFATHADDLITLVTEGALNHLKAENIASARIFGLETSLSARGYGFDLRATYTGLLTFNDDPSICLTCTTRPPLPGRPGDDFVGDVAYTWGPVRVRYGLDVVAHLFTDEGGATAVPDRILQSTGVRVAVPWVRTLRLAFDVSNLFDVRSGLTPGFDGLTTRVPVGDQFDYPLPGRTLLFTARWSPGAAGTQEEAR